MRFCFENNSHVQVISQTPREQTVCVGKVRVVECVSTACEPHVVPNLEYVSFLGV